MPSILFVCTANRFRSPISAAFFLQHLQKNGLDKSWTVSSAGTWAEPGSPVAPSIKWILDHLSLDLSAHKARRIDRDLLIHQDLILVMENNHREALTVEFPEIKDHIYLLMNVVTGEMLDVPDPGVAPEDTFMDVAKELSELIDRGFQKIYLLARQLHLQHQ